MQVKFSGTRSIYAPCYLEQKASTFLVQKRFSEAYTCYQRALVDDPTRALRIASQWKAGTGQLGLFFDVTEAIVKNDLDQFEEGLARVFTEQGEPIPAETDSLLARARYLSCFPDEPPIRKCQPPPYRKVAPRLSQNQEFSLQ